MLLLDSHVALWALDDSPRLGSAARDLIAGSGGTHVSAVSVWELTIKRLLGKVDAPSDLAAELASAGYAALSVTHADAEAIADFPELVRHDPFDRLLVAQAHRAGLKLLTADRVLLALGRDFIVDATR
jgi:PIN domain nuclease of toxin-antitoxin system